MRNHYLFCRSQSTLLPYVRIAQKLRKWSEELRCCANFVDTMNTRTKCLPAFSASSTSQLNDTFPTNTYTHQRLHAVLSSLECILPSELSSKCSNLSREIVSNANAQGNDHTMRNAVTLLEYWAKGTFFKDIPPIELGEIGDFQNEGIHIVVTKSDLQANSVEKCGKGNEKNDGELLWWNLRSINRRNAVTALEAITANSFMESLGIPKRFLWGGGEREVFSLTNDINNNKSQPHLTNTVHRQGNAAAALDILWPTKVQTPHRLRGEPRPGGDSDTAENVFLFKTNNRSSSVPTRTSDIHKGDLTATLSSPTPAHKLNTGAYLGGALFQNSILDSYLTVLTTAMTQSITRCLSSFEGSLTSEAKSENIQRHKQRLVLYVNEKTLCHPLSVAARMVGYQHIRKIPSIPHPATQNMAFSFSLLKKMISEDISAGRMPSIVVLFVLGGGPASVMDPLDEVSKFCSQTGIWCHLHISADLCNPFLRHILRKEMKQKGYGDSLCSGDAELTAPFPPAVKPMYQSLQHEYSQALSRVDSFQIPYNKEDYESSRDGWYLHSVRDVDYSRKTTSCPLFLLAFSNIRKVVVTGRQEMWIPGARTPFATCDASSYANVPHHRARELYRNPSSPYEAPLHGDKEGVNPISQMQWWIKMFYGLGHQYPHQGSLVLPHIQPVALPVLVDVAVSLLLNDTKQASSAPPLLTISQNYDFICCLYERMISSGELEVWRQSLVTGNTLIFRFRLLADESTAQLCFCLQNILLREYKKFFDGNKLDELLPSIQCSLVQLERKYWVALHFGTDCYVPISPSPLLEQRLKQHEELIWKIIQEAVAFTP